LPRKRSPERDRARELWNADRARPLTSIAEELGVPEARVRKWKCEDKWERGEKGTFRNAKKERTETRKLDRKLVAMVEENAELNDKQRAFCLHYVKSFNATRAYQKVYGCSYDTAMSEGWKAIRNPKIAEEIKRLKEARNLAMMADAEDVVLLHMRIAFADITDFVEFGRVEMWHLFPRCWNMANTLSTWKRMCLKVGATASATGTMQRMKARCARRSCLKA